MYSNLFYFRKSISFFIAIFGRICFCKIFTGLILDTLLKGSKEQGYSIKPLVLKYLIIQ